MFSEQLVIKLGKPKPRIESFQEKGNNKDFYKYLNNKRETRRKCECSLKKREDTVMQDNEKTEVLNALFGSVFTARLLQESQISAAWLNGWSQEDMSLVED